MNLYTLSVTGIYLSHGMPFIDKKQLHGEFLGSEPIFNNSRRTYMTNYVFRGIEDQEDFIYQTTCLVFEAAMDRISQGQIGTICLMKDRNSSFMSVFLKEGQGLLALDGQHYFEFMRGDV